MPGRLYAAAGDPIRYPPFRPPYEEDTIMRVSDDGEVMFEKSVVRILYDGGLAPLLTSSGRNIKREWRDTAFVERYRKATLRYKDRLERMDDARLARKVYLWSMIGWQIESRLGS